MKIKVLMIGKSFPEYVNSGIEYYLKKIKHFNDIEWVEIVPKKKADDIETVKKIEFEAIEKYLDSSDLIILLDDKGKHYTSEAFSEFIDKFQSQSVKRMVFIIGGAFGFDRRLYDMAGGKLSLSTMTFSHQIIRIIFLEQLYRGFTIIKGIPYHNA